MAAISFRQLEENEEDAAQKDLEPESPMFCHYCGRAVGFITKTERNEGKAVRDLCDDCKRVGHLGSERSEELIDQTREYIENVKNLGLESLICQNCNEEIRDCRCSRCTDCLELNCLCHLRGA